MLPFVLPRSRRIVREVPPLLARLFCVLFVALYLTASTLHVCDRGLGEALGTPCHAGMAGMPCAAMVGTTGMDGAAVATPVGTSARISAPAATPAVHCSRCKPQPPHCPRCPAPAAQAAPPAQSSAAGTVVLTSNERCQSCPYCLAAMLEGMGAQKANVFRLAVARSVSFVVRSNVPSLVSLSAFRLCDARAPPPSAR